MLSKAFNGLLKVNKLNKSLIRTFGEIVEYSDGELTIEQRKELQAQSKEVRSGREFVQLLKDSAHTEYKVYPNHLGHWNPNDPSYISSPREEHTLKCRIDGYNNMIDEFSSNVKLQEEQYDMIDAMDRPYQRGVAGLDKNVYDTVQDYSEPRGHNIPNPNDAHDILQANSNLHRWVSNTPYIPKLTPLSNEIEWDQMQEDRPVNSHYNMEKGYKFDVLMPYAERIPHVADRLGYPEQLGSPQERLFHMEQDLIHPQYLDQPFVQTPSPHVDPNLNFQEGEVVYENTKVAEWGRGLMWGGKAFGFFAGGYIPFVSFCKTSIPSATMMEGIPGVPYFEHNIGCFDNYNLTGVMFVPALAVSWATFCRILHDQVAPYALRCQYNEDKELLFVWFQEQSGKEAEVVYEMEHLEIVPPSVKSGLQYLSSQDDDGIYMVTDLNKGRNFFMYKEQVYWNPALRAKFLERTTRMWDDSVWDSSKVDVPTPTFDKQVLQIE